MTVQLVPLPSTCQKQSENGLHATDRRGGDQPCSSTTRSHFRLVPHLRDPEGDVRFVEAHSQEEAAGVPPSPVLQQRDGLVRALHVGQRPSGLLRHVDGAQQVGVEAAMLPPAHLGETFRDVRFDLRSKNYVSRDEM